MGGNGRFLNIKGFFGSSSSMRAPPPPTPPPEYICPVCQNLFTDPVVTGSGHTIDRTCAQVCVDLNYIPSLSNLTMVDFSTLIPNLALQTAVPKWCEENVVILDKQVDYEDVAKKVRDLAGEKGVGLVDELGPMERLLINEVVNHVPNPDYSHAYTVITEKNEFHPRSSNGSPITPLPLKRRPACLSPFSETNSSEFYTSGEYLNNNDDDDDDADKEFIRQFENKDPHFQGQGAISLRKITRKDENARAKLCTERLLAALKPLLLSSYETVQVNAIAALVNLSLEKTNKIKIVRSGIIPIVIELLKGRFSEAQEHAAGAIFSLSLEESNRTAIGVLGALPPLMHCLVRSESDRTRSDSALALYNLALDQNNRVKLVKQGAVPTLLAVLRTANEAVAGRVLLVLYQLAASAEGKAAMLESNAVENLVAVLKRGESVSESTRENCVAALYALSHKSMRFKALARSAGAVEVLKAVEEAGSDLAKDKARRLLAELKERRQSEFGGSSEINFDMILEPSEGEASRTRGHRVVTKHGKTTEF